MSKLKLRKFKGELKLITQVDKSYAEELSLQLNYMPTLKNVIVNGDKDRLLHVLYNFTGNAIKYSSDGKRIEISLKIIGSIVCVSVTAFGKGIPKEFHPKIFPKFAQTNVSLARKSTGTGLELSLNKALIELQDGEKGFESKAGKLCFILSCQLLVFKNKKTP